MNRLYSQTTATTYLEGLHTDIPEDAVPISDEVYNVVIANPPMGKVRGHDSEGLPILLDPPTLPDDAAALIAATRYAHEVVGIEVDGVMINTARESQALITSAALSAFMDKNYTCTWKTQSGSVQLNATQLIGVATAVRAHVQACFDREFELLAAVADGSYSDSMRGEGWPV